VLDGAADLLATGRIVGLKMEVSFTPLHEGGMTWREGFDRAESLWMTLMSLDPMFTADLRCGTLVREWISSPERATRQGIRADRRDACCW
jgi:hypothetical protein